MFDKVCLCLTFVERRNFANVILRLIYNTLALVMRGCVYLLQRDVLASGFEKVWYKIRKQIPHGGIMMYEEKMGGKPELLDNSMVTSRFSIRYKILKD